ncbi:hypothetical protein BJ170DRAFT_109074 [Xylariales sp. AK1849]|nr:hypothetical protein BJ170DRAFT_109074 [Xylariales sp. AK1849]
MASPDTAAVGQALVKFALHGAFPEENVSTRRLGVDDFGPALGSLAAAKSRLESEVHTINEETAPDVQSWVANATTLEDDINRSRSLANEIVRRAEAPEVSGQTLREAEEKVVFLRREAGYNRQVHGALTSIKHVNELLDQVEKARDERRVLDSLHLLEKSWAALDQVPASKSCRVMRILDMRAFELKSAVHEVFEHVWNSLVEIDAEKGQAGIYASREGEPMNLPEALIGLKAYKEVDQRMALLWHGIDKAIIGPRTNLEASPLPGISIDNSKLSLSGQTDRSISSLFSDLEQVMSYLSKRLPDELVKALSNVMMPDLMPRIKTVWLDSAVPVSLKEIDEFQIVIDSVRTFCNALRALNYSGFDELQEWVNDAARVWLTKCKETALDAVRAKLARGLGSAKEVERVETQEVSRSEGQELAATGAPAAAHDDDWGAWDNEDDAPAQANHNAVPAINEEDGADAWGWGEDGAAEETAAHHTQANPASENADEDEDGAAWGWGDEQAAEAPRQLTTQTQAPAQRSQTREMTLKETYNISSMPEPVLALISAILEDGAFLVGSEGNPVAGAARGLFTLPTLVLAMFRAVAPYYYALDVSGGGNMFLYNDATYLAQRLADLATCWKARNDLSPRAVTMLRLDNDIKTLQAFAARAYASEMTTQRTVIRDLLGGLQNLLQQDADFTDLEFQIEAATTRVRAMAATWTSILSRSAWCQAVGSLADTLASKMVADVMDLAGIGQDDAYNFAKLITKITELDDLFLPPGAAEDGVPVTSHYAESWLRLKYLSEVLQSNLQDVRYLWMESDLSLYFTVEEVVDLIGLSFVDNARTREVLKEITANPQPRG